MKITLLNLLCSNQISRILKCDWKDAVWMIVSCNGWQQWCYLMAGGPRQFCGNLVCRSTAAWDDDVGDGNSWKSEIICTAFSALTTTSIRRHLCSSTTMTLVVPSVQQSTLGDRAFPVAASRAWNSPTTCHPNCFILHLLSATTETHLFRLSFS